MNHLCAVVAELNQWEKTPQMMVVRGNELLNRDRCQWLSCVGTLLGNYLDQSARLKLTRPRTNKISSIWRLSLPGPQNGMSSAIFSEAMCMHLCLPPMYVDEQASRDRVGKYIGRSKVDLYGIIAAHSYQ